MVHGQGAGTDDRRRRGERSSTPTSSESSGGVADNGNDDEYENECEKESGGTITAMVIGGVGITSSATSLSKLPNDFTITYNCEKKECPLEEELLDYGDEEEEEEEEEEEKVLHGSSSHRRTDKENSSLNKKKSSSSSSTTTPKKGKKSNHFEEHTDDDVDDDIAMNFFDNDIVNNLTSSKQSVPPAPDSPTSLETPRESSSIASPPMLVSIKSARTSMMGVMILLLPVLPRRLSINVKSSR